MEILLSISRSKYFTTGRRKYSFPSRNQFSRPLLMKKINKMARKGKMNQKEMFKRGNKIKISRKKEEERSRKSRRTTISLK